MSGKTPANITLVSAVTLDGKISDISRSAAHFGSAADAAHLLREIALADAVLIGAGTLRAYGASWLIQNPTLLSQRSAAKKDPQPVHVVCSASCDLAPDLPFFSQPFERWLITTKTADISRLQDHFDRVLPVGQTSGGVNVEEAVDTLADAGMRTIVVVAGGRLNAALLEAGCVDEISLTLCPLALGGASAPTLIDGAGFVMNSAKRFRLIEAIPNDDEVFLRYRRASG